MLKPPRLTFYNLPAISTARQLHRKCCIGKVNAFVVGGIPCIANGHHFPTSFSTWDQSDTVKLLPGVDWQCNAKQIRFQISLWASLRKKNLHTSLFQRTCSELIPCGYAVAILPDASGLVSSIDKSERNGISSMFPDAHARTSCKFFLTERTCFALALPPEPQQGSQRLAAPFVGFNMLLLLLQQAINCVDLVYRTTDRLVYPSAWSGPTKEYSEIRGLIQQNALWHLQCTMPAKWRVCVISWIYQFTNTTVASRFPQHLHRRRTLSAATPLLPQLADGLPASIHGIINQRRLDFG